MKGLLKGTMAVLALAALASGGPAAAEQGQAAPPKAGRQAVPQLDTLKRGAQWEHRGAAYAVVPEVRAVLTADKTEAPAAALARKGITGAAVIERKGGFVLYKDSAAPVPLTRSTAPAPLLATSADPRPVVMNLRTRKLAVVLNSIRVELKDITAAEAVASDTGITLGKQFPNRPVVYYTVPAGMDLLTLVNTLRADPRVSSADLELIEFVRSLH